MNDVTTNPSFPGQWSVDQEVAAEIRIWMLLQEYGHKTGALAGESVLDHFRRRTKERERQRAAELRSSRRARP